MSITRNPSNTSNAENSSPQSQKPGMWDKVKKTTADISAKTVTTSKNTKETISIQKKQLMISNRKKAFGTEYLNLVENDASREELEACLERSMEDIVMLKSKVAKYEGRISANKVELERKLGGISDVSTPTDEINYDILSDASSRSNDTSPNMITTGDESVANETRTTINGCNHERNVPTSSPNTSSQSFNDTAGGYPYDETTSPAMEEERNVVSAFPDLLGQEPSSTGAILGTAGVDESLMVPTTSSAVGDTHVQSEQHPTPSAPIDPEIVVPVVHPIPEGEKDMPGSGAVVY